MLAMMYALVSFADSAAILGVILLIVEIKFTFNQPLNIKRAYDSSCVGILSIRRTTLDFLSFLDLRPLDFLVLFNLITVVLFF